MDNPILDQILASARRNGLNQARLAQRSGVSVENLSRIKKRGNVQLATLERLAETAGGSLQFVSTAPAAPPPTALLPATPGNFQQRHASLAWANPGADLTTLLRAALLRPRFQTLLEAALAFGLPRLTTLWSALLASDPDAQRVQIQTERILRNIEHGYQQAQA